MKDNTLEYRSGSIVPSVDGEIAGLAIVVNSRSELLGGEFYEVIAPTALEGVIENNDIKLILNHNPFGPTIARSKFGQGSLELQTTDKGLEFKTKTKNQEILDGIERGDYDACSFGFCVGEDQWEKNADGTYTRTILSFSKVLEISMLSEAPAYSATQVALRSLESFKASEVRKDEDEPKPEDEAPKEEETPAEEPKSEEEAPKEEETPKSDEEDEKKSCSDEDDDEDEKRSLQSYFEELRKKLE